MSTDVTRTAYISFIRRYLGLRSSWTYPHLDCYAVVAWATWALDACEAVYLLGLVQVPDPHETEDEGVNVGQSPARQDTAAKPFLKRRPQQITKCKK